MEKLITVRQAALIVGCHANTVRRYIREGRLKAYKPKQRLLINRKDLDNFVKSALVVAEDEH